MSANGVCHNLGVPPAQVCNQPAVKALPTSHCKSASGFPAIVRVNVDIRFLKGNDLAGLLRLVAVPEQSSCKL